MGGSSRPSLQFVQRSLVVGVLIGVIVGCVVGIGLSWLYVLRNPPVYSGGAFPNELSSGYQNHYLIMTIDSYIVNQDIDAAAARLDRFGVPTKIRALGERYAAYVAAGRGGEAQLINNLAVGLRDRENWSADVIAAEIQELVDLHRDDSARVQAINAFGAALGVVPIPTEAGAPAEAPAAAPAAEPAQGGGLPTLQIVLCCLGLLVIGLIVYIVGRRRFEARKAPSKQQIVWEGEGPAPIKQWSGTFELGHDTYDEFFTIETDEGDFLGESGMGIMESIPGTSPKQVTAFDVGLFDKTDITTLSRVVMTEQAYNDETIRMKIDANPQAEAVVAAPGKTFSFETSALRVDARIDEVEITQGEGGQSYFTKLKVSMDLFLKEGVDLRKGEMDIPEQYQ